MAESQKQIDIRTKGHLGALLVLSKALSREIYTVTEYGAGKFSTRFWLDKERFPNLCLLHIFEDDPQWAKAVEEKLEGPVRWILTKASLYDYMDETNFDSDLYFIDNGKSMFERIFLIQELGKKLPQGIIVIHDTDIWEYQVAIQNNFLVHGYFSWEYTDPVSGSKTTILSKNPEHIRKIREETDQ